jgi:hypothetical protein
MKREKLRKGLSSDLKTKESGKKVRESNRDLSDIY